VPDPTDVTKEKKVESLDELFAKAEKEARPDMGTEKNTDASHNGTDVETTATQCSGEVVSGPLQKSDKPKPCIHTDADRANKTCPICYWPFCCDCASVLDSQYCHLCMPVLESELVSSPLVDVDGIQHEGRKITLGPTFGTFAKRVSDMNISELEQHVEQYKHLIKQAETALDTRRVQLGMLHMELAQQKDQQRRRLRGVKVARSRTIGVPADGSRPVRKAPDLKKFIKMVEALKALQDLKKKQAQDKTIPRIKTTEVEK
jgi:hypothetical protein